MTARLPGRDFSYFTKQRLVGIVGADFPPEALTELQERGVDISGLTGDPAGKTFHWTGRYEGDMKKFDAEMAKCSVASVATHLSGTLEEPVALAPPGVPREVAPTAPPPAALPERFASALVRAPPRTV